jgi:hypothetical protein
MRSPVGHPRGECDQMRPPESAGSRGWCAQGKRTHHLVSNGASGCTALLRAY